MNPILKSIIEKQRKDFQQLEDIYAAMNCIDGLMPHLKAELGHCYMVGDSAGAMLAMYASAIQRNPRLAKAAGIRPSYLEIISLALISGMFYTTGRIVSAYLCRKHSTVTSIISICSILT